MAATARARTYVEGLERIDAELRTRMARLGLGEIPDAEGDTGGCGLCYEPYEADDRPAWLDASAEETRVVGIPCAGQHVVHATCLAAWLSTTDPGRWTCPFCRGRLPAHPPAWSAHAKLEAGKAARSVREEVRFQERKMGWRCDDPSCLPSYPDEREGPERELCHLTPCRHGLHLDCLETLLRVQGSYGDGLAVLEPPTRSTPYRLPQVQRANSFASPPTAARPGSVHSSLRGSIRKTRKLLRNTRRWICLPCGGDEMDAYLPLHAAARATTSPAAEMASPAAATPSGTGGQSTEGERAEVEVQEGKSHKADCFHEEERKAPAKQDESKMVGRWIRCPACRRDAWALTPAGASA